MKKFFGIVFVIFAVVLPHELSHFAAAKLAGVGVARASIGFGPPIGCAWLAGTEFCLSSIPLGGYVALADRDALEMYTDRELMELRQNPRAWQEVATPSSWLSRQTLFVRFFIAIAGAVGNFLFVLVCARWLFRWAGSGRLSLREFDLLDREATGGFIGPIGLFKMAARAGERGWVALIMLSTRFSLGIGILQLLPIPFFDGGHLMQAGLLALLTGEVGELVKMGFTLYLVWLIYRLSVLRLSEVRAQLAIRADDRWQRIRIMLQRLFG